MSRSYGKWCRRYSLLYAEPVGCYAGNLRQPRYSAPPKRPDFDRVGGAIRSTASSCVPFVHDSGHLHKGGYICAHWVTCAQFKMLSVRRVVFWQAAAVVCAIALTLALSRFFPVISFVEALQERVMSWGAW